MGNNILTFCPPELNNLTNIVGVDEVGIWSDTAIDENIRICKEFILTKLNGNE